MCGLIGSVNAVPQKNNIDAILNIINHRGPDERGYFIDDSAKIFLGHTRLAVIGLQNGSQPLHTDKTVAIVNGEFYNYRSIKKELEITGCMFKTETDSEILLHLYEQFNVDLLSKLHGEFAFVLFDKLNNKLLLARDRFGVKPLYFAIWKDSLFFSSTIKGILIQSDITPGVDKKKFATAIMTNGSLQMNSIVPVDPGSYIEYDISSKKVKIVKYYEKRYFNAGKLETNEAFYIPGLRELLKESVHARLQADVPVGVYLSGGLDSSIIGAIAAKKIKRIKTFSIGFISDPNFDESKIAHRTAEFLNAEHHELLLTNDDLIENLESCLWHTETPMINLHNVGKFLLSKLAGKHVKVVLTGEGADELFLGYDFFQNKAAKHDPLAQRGFTDKRLLKHSVASKMEAILGYRSYHSVVFNRFVMFFKRILLSPAMRNYIDLDEFLTCLELETNADKDRARYTKTRKLQADTVSDLPDYILSALGDRMEMAHSVEGRVPFLDHILFEYSITIPDELKIRNGISKFILREAFKDDLIPEVYHGEKRRFVAPPVLIHKGYSRKMDELIDTYLSKDALIRCGLFNAKLVLFLINHYKPLTKFRKFNTVYSASLLYILSLQIIYAQNTSVNRVQRT